MTGSLANHATEAGKTHILTLTPFYPSEGDDSGGCFIYEPIVALEKAGVVSTVFAVQPFYRGRKRERKSDSSACWFRYFSLPSGFGLPTAGAFLFARIIAAVRHLHHGQPIDLIHAHSALPCGHAAMLVSRELGIPFVVSVHGLDVFSTQQVRGRAATWCRRISQNVYSASRRVICISEHVRENVLQGTGRMSRTSVVHNGVDPELFSPGDPTGDEKTTVLSVGNLIPIKGHDVLIRAVASLIPDFPALTLEIIGVGPELLRLQALAQQLGIGQNLIFSGRRSRLEVATAMRRCTVFALPSRYEGLGCVYLEAMSTGKPVIGCRGQGIAEIIRHGTNGFLVGVDNDRELGLALGMLLRDPSRRRALGSAARDTVLESLTLDQQAENFARIYRESVS